MKLSELKNHLSELDSFQITLPNGEFIPAHFHITEVGLITRDFIDCGGTRRTEQWINMQLWTAEDFDHRLAPSKLLGILEMAQDQLELDDLSIEMEYQSGTIGRFGVDFDNGIFKLSAKHTDCLAKEKCEIPTPKESFDLSGMVQNAKSCTPGGGCC